MIRRLVENWKPPPEIEAYANFKVVPAQVIRLPGMRLPGMTIKASELAGFPGGSEEDSKEESDDETQTQGVDREGQNDNDEEFR